MLLGLGEHPCQLRIHRGEPLGSLLSQGLSNSGATLRRGQRSTQLRQVTRQVRRVNLTRVAT